MESSCCSRLSLRAQKGFSIVKIAFLGDAGVGKTSIFERMQVDSNEALQNLRRSASTRYVGNNKPTLDPSSEIITIKLDKDETKRI